MFSKEKLIHLLIIFFVSIVAIFAHGYQFAVSDQEIFIPYILRWQDPSLFQNDLLFDQPSRFASIFYPLSGFLSKIFDLEIIFFLGFLVFQFFFLLAIYRLTLAIFKNKKIAYLSLPLFVLPKFIGGTATMTFDTFFGYRSIGVIFFIFYLAYLLEKRWTQALIFAAIGFIFHPLSIIGSIAIFPILFAKDKKILPTVLKVAIPILALTLVLIFLVLPKDITWLEIIKARDDYLFPSTWSARAWAAMFLYFSLVFVFLNYLAKSLKKQILLIVIVSLAIFLVNFFILEIIRIPHIAQFQLVRSISPVAYIGLILTPLLLLSNNFLLKVLGAIAYVSLVINAFGLFLITFIAFTIVQILSKYPKYANFKIESRLFVPAILTLSLLASIIVGVSAKTIDFPKPKNDWIDLQLWSRENTAKTDIFLVPPTQTGFRIFSQRSIIGDIKDGAVVMYNQSYASAWRERMKNFENFQQFKKEDFVRVKAKYQFDYIVASQSLQVDLPVIFQNQSFIIYKSDND